MFNIIKRYSGLLQERCAADDESLETVEHNGDGANDDY